jgi:hypothetical protein
VAACGGGGSMEHISRVTRVLLFSVATTAAFVAGIVQKHRCAASGILMSDGIRDWRSDSGALTMSTITTIPRPLVVPSASPIVPAEERGVMCDLLKGCFTP